MLKEDTVQSWLADHGYDDKTAKAIVEKMRKDDLAIFEGYEVFELNLRVSQFSGYSNMYTLSALDEIETLARRKLDDDIGFLNDKHEKNYDITRIDQ